MGINCPSQSAQPFGGKPNDIILISDKNGSAMCNFSLFIHDEVQHYRNDPETGIARPVFDLVFMVLDDCASTRVIRRTRRNRRSAAHAEGTARASRVLSIDEAFHRPAIGRRIWRQVMYIERRHWSQRMVLPEPDTRSGDAAAAVLPTGGCVLGNQKTHGRACRFATVAGIHTNALSRSALDGLVNGIVLDAEDSRPIDVPDGRDNSISSCIADGVVVDIQIESRMFRIYRAVVGAGVDARRVRGVVSVDRIEGDDALAGVRTAARVITEFAAGNTIALDVGDVVGLAAGADAEESVALIADRNLNTVGSHTGGSGAGS